MITSKQTAYALPAPGEAHTTESTALLEGTAESQLTKGETLNTTS